MTVEMDFNRWLDIIVVLLDVTTLAIVVRLIVIWARLEGALYLRAGLGVVAIAMCYQITAAGSRVYGEPIEPIFQSGWSLKDFGLFMYFTGITVLHYRTGLLSKGKVPPLVFRATDYGKKDLG